MRRAIFLVSALTFAAFGLARPATAAPQILGLVAYNDAGPMTCQMGQCSAELITLCLQKHRDNPLPGTRYQFQGKEAAALLVTDAEGNQRSLPASEHVNITTARSFTAVRVEITERKLRELGGVKVALTVGSGVSLLPEPVPGDRNPITQHEIDYTTAFLRVEADRWLKGTGDRTVAARMVNRMVNIAPRVGRLDADGRAQLWDKVANTEAGAERAAGRQYARELFGECKYVVEDVGHFFSMRRCLETKHDELMLDMNTAYWDATKPGS